MYTFFMVLHGIICLLIVALILVQRSEGGGLVGGSSGGGLVSARGQANLLTRATAILAACFFANSLVLAILAGGYTKAKTILDPLEKASASLQMVEPAAPAATPDNTAAKADQGTPNKAAQ
jgi:preprotein translocase subunit SecG